jgi:hypothetical protein
MSLVILIFVIHEYRDCSFGAYKAAFINFIFDGPFRRKDVWMTSKFISLIIFALIVCGLSGCVSQSNIGKPECREIKNTFTTSGGLVAYTTHEYDSRGHKVRSRIEFSIGEKGTTEYTYDENGFLIKEFYSSLESSYSHMVVYENDKTGKPLTRRIVGSVLPSYTVYEYDSSGTLMRITTTRQEGENPSYLDYYYSDSGVLLKTIAKDQTGDLDTTLYFYDESGNVSEKRTSSKDSSSVTKFEYECR